MDYEMSGKETVDTADGYVSEEDEDYVPEANVDDIDYPSDEDGVSEDEQESAKGSKRKSRSEKKTGKKEEIVTSGEVEEDCGADFLDDLFGIPASSSTVPEKKDPEVGTYASKQTTTVTITQTDTNTETSTETNVQSKTTVVTDVFDFAGEEIKVKREVTMEQLAAEEEKKTKEREKSSRPNVKRTGLGTALNLLSKKPKISVLDKSNLDWETFKDEKKIAEDIATFNRGKDGYLNKVDFLQRTDQRQFEKEKNIRATLRKK